MLEITDLHLGYGEGEIIHGVSLDVPENSVVAVLGRNGVGKTTLLRGIMGLNTVLDGQIMLDGENITHMQPFEIASRGIALVPQSRDIFSSLSVRNNIRIGSASKPGRFLDKEIDDSIYEYFPMLEEKSEEEGGTLSGGQQQQLAIGRALNSDPRLLLLDEPSEGIQPSIVADIKTRIQQILEERDLSVLLVEQNLDFALDLADYCYIMESGQIVENGPTEELRSENKIRKHLEI